jgi:hypothetical protein
MPCQRRLRKWLAERASRQRCKYEREDRGARQPETTTPSAPGCLDRREVTEYTERSGLPGPGVSRLT